MVERTVLVTGASKGVGKEIALALANAGHRVVVNYRTDETGAEAVVEEVLKRGHKADLLQADVTVPSQVESMIDEIIRGHGRLDALINNAGIYRDSTVWKMPPETWHDVLNVNLTATFLCAKAAIPHMRSQGWGRIINISSVVGQTGFFGTSNYAAAKAGVFGFTKTVAKEVAKFGITVNCLCLGYFGLGMFLRLPDHIQKQIIEQIPLGRPGSSNELTAPVLFLFSEDASYITGQIIHVNGGCFM